MDHGDPGGDRDGAERGGSQVPSATNRGRTRRGPQRRPVVRIALMGLMTISLVASAGCSRGATSSTDTRAPAATDTVDDQDEASPTTASHPTETTGATVPTTGETTTTSVPTDDDGATADRAGPQSGHEPTTTTSAPPRSRGRIVVIDPGHNGNNWRHTAEINRLVDAGGFQKACNTTGTAGGGLTEAEFNLAVAEHLRASLSARGMTVIMTREDNQGWGPCIDERGLTAARAGADLLVSIHADGSAANDRGFHVISPSSVRGHTEATTVPSAVAATAVRDALVRAGFQPSTYIGRQGLIQRGDLGTLNRAGVPAIMLEAGNMKNPSDLALFTSDDGRRRLATAIADGVEHFLAGL